MLLLVTSQDSIWAQVLRSNLPNHIRRDLALIIPNMYTVFIRGIEFYGYHGVPAEERFVGHRYKVDVELRVEGSADMTDHISETVDYGAVAALLVQVGTTKQAHTVERLARIMGDELLAGFASVSSLWISVSKPFPPCPVIAEQAGVEMEIARA